MINNINKMNMFTVIISYLVFIHKLDFKPHVQYIYGTVLSEFQHILSNDIIIAKEIKL